MASEQRIMAKENIGKYAIVASMPLFSLFRFADPMGQPLLALIFATAAYFLSIGLFFGIAWLAYQRSAYLLWSGLVIAFIVGYMIAGLTELWMVFTTWSMLMFAGLLTGRMSIDRIRQLPIYVAGVVSVSILALAQLVPIWSEYEAAIKAVGEKAVATATSQFTLLGNKPEIVADATAEMTRMVDLMVWLLPAILVLGFIAQYSIGYLWFIFKVDQKEVFIKRLRPYTMWKMPFYFTPVLIAVIGMRLLGGETTQWISDNLLAILSVYYCITGLSLLEYLLGKLKMPLWMKIAFYVMLFFTQILGYVILVFVGFIDGFADWRKTTKVKLV